MPNHVCSLINDIASRMEPHSTTVTILKTTFQAASGKSSSAGFCASTGQVQQQRQVYLSSPPFYPLLLASHGLLRME